jgi:hypothetical protein
MSTVQNHEQLLLHLAGSGDPSAFYTLIAPFANIAYVSERNSGKGHNEALTTLVPHFKKIYKSFFQHPAPNDFGSWYKEHEKKVFSGPQEVSIESLNGQNVSGVLTSDLSHFDWTLGLVFQRQYGKLKRTKKQRGFLFPGAKTTRLSRLQAVLLIIGILGIAVAGFMAYLSFSKTRLEVVLISNDSKRSTVSVNGVFGPRGKTFVNDSMTSVRHETKPMVIVDTVRVHDTVRLFNRPKPHPPTSTINEFDQGNNSFSPPSKTVDTSSLRMQTPKPSPIQPNAQKSPLKKPTDTIR